MLHLYDGHLGAHQLEGTVPLLISGVTHITTLELREDPQDGPI